jgi:tripartite-type tricarboxylate transporter receptor subunit TctC
MPQMPTMHETLPGYEVVGWYGLLAPAGLPAPILNLLNTEVVHIATQSAFRAQVIAEGAEVVTNTPEKFREFLKADVAKWSTVAKDGGAKID